MHMAIETHNLSVFYNEVPALVDINVVIEKEQIVDLVGSAGAGKTTFFAVLLGLVKPHLGSVRLNGVDVSHSGDEISYMPVNKGVNFDFPSTLMEFALLGRCRKTPWFLSLGTRDHDHVMDALEMVGLAEAAQQQVAPLSCGERQRLLLARAIAQGGDILLLDDPFACGGLEAELLMVDVLKELRTQGKTIIVAHHDLAPAMYSFDNVMFLETILGGYGCPLDIVAKNTPKQIRLDVPNLDEVKYVGGKG